MASPFDTWRTRYGITILLPAILLTMIMMRMVWVELRGYTISLKPALTQALHAPDFRPKALKSCLPADISPLTSLIQVTPVPPVAASPGYLSLLYVLCRVSNEDFSGRWLVLQKVLLSSTVLFTSAAIRVTTGSWLYALLSAVTLFSRGRFLSDLGQVSPEVTISFFLSGAAMFAAHYLRSLFMPMFVLSLWCLVSSSLLDLRVLGVLLGLLSAITLGIYFYRGNVDQGKPQKLPPLVEVALTRVLAGLRLRLHKDEHVPIKDSNSVLSPGLWHPLSEASYRPIWTKFYLIKLLLLTVLAIISGLVGMFMMRYVLSAKGPILSHVIPENSPFLATWYAHVLGMVDIHLGVSFIAVIAMVITRHSACLPSLSRLSLLVLIGVIFTGGLSLIFDYQRWALIQTLPLKDQSLMGSLESIMTPFVYWFEPLILSLGVASIYYAYRYIQRFSS